MGKSIFDADFLNAVRVVESSGGYKYRIRKKGVFRRRYIVTDGAGLADEEILYRGLERNTIIQQKIEISDASKVIATLSKIPGQFIYRIEHEGYPDVSIDLGLAIDKEVQFEFASNGYHLNVSGKQWELEGERSFLCQFCIGICYIITFSS
jgi:hypothetical protein